MLCENCKATLPTLKTRTRRVNEHLSVIGMAYWNTLAEAFQAIDGALLSNSFSEMSEATEEAGTENSLHANVGEKWLHISWHQMISGRYEVTAYVN